MAPVLVQSVPCPTWPVLALLVVFGHWVQGVGAQGQRAPAAGAALGGGSAAQLREVHRPMLTSRYLAGLARPDGDFDPASGAAFGAQPSLFGTSKLKRMKDNLPDPEPRPYAPVPPFTIHTTRGEHKVAAGKDASYLFVLYSKEDSMQTLWYNSSATAFFRAMPPRAHVVFAATDGAGSQGAVQALRERMEGARGFQAVQQRLHFMEEPVALHCTAQEYPKCRQEPGQSIVHQALVSWGSIRPSLTVTADGAAEELDASGATGWLPSITDVIQSKGAHSLQLAVWGGEACDGSAPTEDVKGKMAMVERGTCGFYTKVSNAMKAGAAAVLVTDSEDSGGTTEMGCGAPDPCKKSDLSIPAAMISYAQGQKLWRQHAAGTALSVKLDARYEGEHFIGIDHHGKLREVGQVPPSGADASLALAFVALEAQYYEYERDLDEEAAQKDTLEVTLLHGADQDEAGTYLAGGRGLYANAFFPSEEVMAKYDTMKLLMQLECKCGMDKCCGEWDYVVQLHVCSEPGMTPARPALGPVGANGVEKQGYSYASCNIEVGRWVTAYGRPGKWMTDASGVLPVVRRGGRQHFVLSQPDWSVQKYRVVSKLLLSNTGKRGVPVASLPLFTGGEFDEDYNKRHVAKEFDIPYRTMRAEIHSFITGHGWGTDASNCAEFCETQHRFSIRVGMDVDGETFVANEEALYEHKLTDAGSDLGCASKVQDGVTPNQYGTWNYGRAGWCPGGAVSPWVVDISKGIRPGMKAMIGYAALYNNSSYAPKPCHGKGCASNGFPPEIKMVSRLVLYQHAHDRDLTGATASEPASWKPLSASGTNFQKYSTW
jgi:hypothetical protein